MTIDTLRLAKRLKDAKVPDEQAELLAEVFRETQESGTAQLATKQDLETLRLATKADLATLRLATKQDLETLRLATKTDLERVELGLRREIDRVEQTLRREITAVETRIAEAKFDRLKGIVNLLFVAQLLAVAGLYFK